LCPKILLCRGPDTTKKIEAIAIAIRLQVILIYLSSALFDLLVVPDNFASIDQASDFQAHLAVRLFCGSFRDATSDSLRLKSSRQLELELELQLPE